MKTGNRSGMMAFKYAPFKNIKADILNFKDVLGLADKSGELSQIDLFLSRLQNEIDNTENILPQKCRMYRCLAVGAGIILSIIII